MEATSVNAKEIGAVMESLRGERPDVAVYGGMRKRLGEVLGADVYAIGTQWQRIWYRGQLCGPDGFPNLQRMIYAPPSVASWNRANFPGEAMCYASWNLGAILAELRANAGDFVQIIGIRPRGENVEPIKCTVLGALIQTYRSGRTMAGASELDKVLRKVIDVQEVDEAFCARLYADAVISEEFSRPVENDQRHKYFLSACFSKRLHDADTEILFPSVQAGGAMNLAVRAQTFDKMFEVLFTGVFAVTESPGLGVHGGRRLRHTASFAPDGTIEWDKKARLPYTVDLEGNELLAREYRGWRVPTS
jgi:hypothetical protein